VAHIIAPITRSPTVKELMRVTSATGRKQSS
jgi:hypothetical protein